MLVRQGNEGVLANHPGVDRTWTWTKKRGKYRALLSLAWRLRSQRYDVVFNLHRFASSGLLTALSGAPHRIGFRKNPLSRCYTRRYPHVIRAAPAESQHEVDRNLSLLAGWAPTERERPRLYPDENDDRAVAPYREEEPYYVLAPASVWYTKQWPEARWAELIDQLRQQGRVLLIGAPNEAPLCKRLARSQAGVTNLAGQLSLLQAAALMRRARRVYANDSAPLHLASAMNAPTTALFCSTVPAFGFGPLADDALILETPTPLPCRPCGLHGYSACPEGHFRCAWNISAAAALAAQ
jgi:heptosyltransferase-2